MIVSAKLYNNDGSELLENLLTASNITFQDQLNDTGSFSLTINKDDPSLYNINNVKIGNIIKFTAGTSTGMEVFAGVIETIVIDASSSNSGYGRVLNVSGRGVLALLENAIAYPTTMSDTVEELNYTNQTAGWIINGQLTVAAARDTLTFVTPPNSGEDYYADGYDTYVTLSIPIGTNYLDITKSLIESAVDAWMDKDFNLCFANSRGKNKTISAMDPLDVKVFRIGRDIAGATIEKATPFFNKLLTKYGKVDSTHTVKYVEVNNTASESEFGNKESFVYFDNTRSITTATNASNRVLNTSKIPTDSITVEMLGNSVYNPYDDYEVGDIVTVEYMPNEFADYRVNSITVTVNQDGTISVIPEFGSMRLTLDRRLAKALAKLEGSSANGLSTSSATHITGGGGGTGAGTSVSNIDKGTVVTYDSGTGYGTVTLASDSSVITFRNATRETLGTGNLVAIIQDYDSNYYAIAIIYTTSEVPITLPSTIAPAGFPADISGAGYGVIDSNTSIYYRGRTNFIDRTGNFSGHAGSFCGLDDLHVSSDKKIISYNFASGLATNLGTDTNISYGYNYIMGVQDSGRLFRSSGGDLKYKNVSESWASVAKTGRITDRYLLAIDEKNGWVWFWDKPETMPSGHYYWSLNYWRPEDSTYTEFLTIDDITGYGYNNTPGLTLLANNGKLVYSISAGVTTLVYSKNSGDASSATVIGSFDPTDIVHKGVVGANGMLYWYDKDIVTNNWFIYSVGGTTYNTGLPYDSTEIQSIHLMHSGVAVINGKATETFLGVGTTRKLYPLIATTNFASTAIPFYDPEMVSQLFDTDENLTFALHDNIYYGYVYITNSNFVQHLDGTATWAVRTGHSYNRTTSTFPTDYTTYKKEKIYRLTGL